MKPRRRLRVLHVGKFYPPFMGGMETHLQSLCGGLQELVDLNVIVANDARHSATDVVDGINVMRLGRSFNFAAAPICPDMSRRIREAEADIIHIHVPNPTAILAYLASRHGGRLVVTYHSDIIRQKVLGRAFRPVLDRALRRCSAIIATSPNYITSSSILSTLRDRCRVIPHGITVERFQNRDPVATARLREQYGPRTVISVGRLIYYKGFKYLIQAMSKVEGRLLIVGDGPLRSELEREARNRRVADRVIFLGEVEDVAPYYHASDLFVLASIARSEAFGIVQLEAMACGKPVINTRLDSGVPFVSLDGVTGITVPAADPDALAGAINLLLDNPELRSKYGEAARRRVEQEFSLDQMVRRTFHLYTEIAEMSLSHAPTVSVT
ncbi:MAG TPA: glycosyltransferase [Blastocatellia bacterium]|nr:glycosyltransferase [Blastocatellia bacterium]